MATFEIVVDEVGNPLNNPIATATANGAIEPDTTAEVVLHPGTQKLVVKVTGLGHPDKGR